MATQPASPPPAYFLSLSLENVRSFGERQTISFARPDGRPAQWTIILGDNGVGKTTVLKALASMVHKEGLFRHNLNQRMPILWDNAIRLWFPFRKLGERNLILITTVQLGSLVQKFVDGQQLRCRVELSAERKEETISRGGMASTIGGNPEQLICYGYGAGRTVGNSTLSETPETVDTCASLFNDRADLLNPEEWFLFADYRVAKDKDPLTTQNFELLKKALLQVMAEGEITDMEVGPVLLGGGSPRQGVRFKTPYGWVRLKDMSLGYQTLVVWLTDFASKLFVRYPNSQNPLAEPAIVLIDEIDLHLHPSWQRKLLKSLGDIFPNTQFIATAHSPLVVQAAGDEGANVVLLRREGDQTIVSQNPVDVRGWRVDQILTSTFFNLDTARSLETEKKLARQAKLLNQEKLSPRQRRELDALTLELEGQPMGSTGANAEQEEAALLRQLTERLGSGLPELTAG